MLLSSLFHMWCRVSACDLPQSVAPFLCLQQNSLGAHALRHPGCRGLQPRQPPVAALLEECGLCLAVYPARLCGSPLVDGTRMRRDPAAAGPSARAAQCQPGRREHSLTAGGGVLHLGATATAAVGRRTAAAVRCCRQPGPSLVDCQGAADATGCIQGHCWAADADCDCAGDANQP
jgi:hypothetical protein